MKIKLAERLLLQAVELDAEIVVAEQEVAGGDVDGGAATGGDGGEHGPVND